MAIQQYGLSESVLKAARGRTPRSVESYDFSEINKLAKEERDKQAQRDKRRADMLSAGMSENFRAPLKKSMSDLQERANRGEIEVGSPEWNDAMSDIESQFNVSKANYDKGLDLMSKIEADPDGFQVQGIKEVIGVDGQTYTVPALLSGQEALEHVRNQMYAPGDPNANLYDVNATFSSEIGSVLPMGEDPETALMANAGTIYQANSESVSGVDRLTGGIVDVTKGSAWKKGMEDTSKIQFERDNLGGLQQKHMQLVGKGTVDVPYEDWVDGYIDQLFDAQQQTSSKILKDDSGLDAAKLQFEREKLEAAKTKETAQQAKDRKAAEELEAKAGNINTYNDAAKAPKINNQAVGSSGASYTANVKTSIGGTEVEKATVNVSIENGEPVYTIFAEVDKPKKRKTYDEATGEEITENVSSIETVVRKTDKSEVSDLLGPGMHDAMLKKAKEQTGGNAEFRKKYNY
jgi:hypothetical protein